MPAGAIPKDGPSAGITMTTALASLLTGRPVKHTVGMTGEVTLQGRVLPIGGLKQKVLAAHAAGITDVIIPERNRGDLDDVPEDVRDEMTFHPVMSIGEVLDLALEPAPSPSVAGRVAADALPPLPAAARGGPPRGDLLGRRYALAIVYASPLGRHAVQRVQAGARPGAADDALGPPRRAGRGRASSSAASSTRDRRAPSTS